MPTIKRLTFSVIIVLAGPTYLDRGPIPCFLLMDIGPAHLAQPQEPSAAGRMSGGSYPPMSNPIAVVSTQYLSLNPVDLAVSEKTISLSDGDYAVTDVKGAVLFKVRAVVLSLRDHRLLLDAAGNPVVTLKQKAFFLSFFFIF